MERIQRDIEEAEHFINSMLQGKKGFTLNESQMKNLRDFEGRHLFFGTIMTDGLDVVKENFGKRLIEQEESLKQLLAISQDPAGEKKRLKKA